MASRLPMAPFFILLKTLHHHLQRVDLKDKVKIKAGGPHLSVLGKGVALASASSS